MLTPHDRGSAARTLATGLALAAVAALVMAQTDEPGSTAGDRLARLGALAPDERAPWHGLAMRVALMITCLVDLFEPDIGEATVAVL